MTRAGKNHWLNRTERQMILRATSAIGDMADRLAGGSCDVGRSPPPSLSPRQQVAELLNPHNVSRQWTFPIQELEAIVMRAAESLHNTSVRHHRDGKRRTARYRSHRLPVRAVLRLFRLKPGRIETAFSHDQAIAMYLNGFMQQLKRLEAWYKQRSDDTVLETAMENCQQLITLLAEHLPDPAQEDS
jgi:hypothetical protein